MITAQQPLLSAAPASVSCGRSRSRALSSFHLTLLRHLPPLCFGRSRSQPSASIQTICHRDLSSSPLGGCRCALCRRICHSALSHRSAALTLRSLLQIPAFCLSAQGITARLAAPPSKSSSLHRSAHRTPGTPRCRLLLSNPAAAFQHFEPTFVTVFSFLAAGSLLTYNYQLRFVTFRQTLCRRFPYGRPLGLLSRLLPRPLFHLHAIAANRMQLQPIVSICSRSKPFAASRNHLQPVFPLLSLFFSIRDARISWLFSAFCSNNVLEK